MLLLDKYYQYCKACFGCCECKWVNSCSCLKHVEEERLGEHLIASSTNSELLKLQTPSSEKHSLILNSYFSKCPA